MIEVWVIMRHKGWDNSQCLPKVRASTIGEGEKVEL